MNIVFSRAALNACLQHIRDEDWFDSFDVPTNGHWDVLSYDILNTRFLVHRHDGDDSPKIVIFGVSPSTNGLSPLPRAARFQALTRIHRAATAAARPPLWLPPDWSVFHEGNLIAFFATTRDYGNLRWIMEQLPGVAHDVSFWELTSEDRPVLLHNYRPDSKRLGPLLEQWPIAIATVDTAFNQLPPPPPEALADQIDLEQVSSAAVTKLRTYDAWLPHLSALQASFINDNSRTSMKVRGPAGSGKTLALEMKLLRELYNAREAKRDIRILFATHSWAIALQVDEGLRSLDISGDLSGVDVIPLLVLAQATLPRERAIAELRLLGEDSLSGKQEQLDYISLILNEARSSDWLAFRGRASAAFRARVDSQEPAEVRSLVWDLMNEFASVLSANGILPGINAERRYYAIARSSWMMPLEPNSADRLFVLHVYDRYVSTLRAGSAMSSDQLINDFWNYLETFAWNIRRQTAGYDMIFVDELHLFSEQERLTLNLLTRKPDQYPRMYMGLDPRQSPSEVYAGYSSPPRADSGEADLELGTYGSVDFKTIYRFTAQILHVLRHLNRSYPSVDGMGEDWILDLNTVDSAAEGPKPLLVTRATVEDEITAIAKDAKEASLTTDGRVAIVLLDPLLLPQYQARLDALDVKTVLIASRNDTERLRYTKKGIVLSAAEYVAGLQFNTVLCGGFVNTSTTVAHSGHARRRLLSLLYLAISRATYRVLIYVNDSIGGVPNVLESAFSADLVVAPS